jgi:enterochelin esterase-like enzyme
VTTVAIAAVLGTAVHEGVFHHELPLDVAFRYGFSGRAIGMGHWSTVVTSQFLTRDPFMAISIAVSLAVMLGVYEMVAGTWRATVVAVVTACAGPLLVAAGLGLGSILGNEFAGRTLSTLDYGGSAVTAGAGGALVAVLGMRRLRWFAAFWVLVGLLAHHQIADWEHLVAFTTGYGLGSLLGAPVPRATTTTARWRVAVPLLVAAVVLGLALPDRVVPPRRPPSLRATGTTIGRHTAAALRRSQRSDPPPGSPATVIAVAYPTPSLGGTHAAYVVLPPGYAGSHRRYPVIELLHGRPGSPNDVLTGLDPVGAESLPGVPPFIAVVPDGHGPVVAEGDFADITSQRLGTAVSDDLRSWVDRHYRTDGDWSVAGLSAGGYGAAYLGARQPGEYQAVCSLSGNFVPEGPAFQDQPVSVLRADTPLLHARADGPRVLLIAGAADRGSVTQAELYARALTVAGEDHRVEIVPGAHTWAVWNAAFPACVRFMLEPRSPVTGTAPTPVAKAATAPGRARPA